MKKIQIDGVEYNIEEANQLALSQVDSIKFVTEQLIQKHNELQILDTAKISYMHGIRKEIETKK